MVKINARHDDTIHIDNREIKDVDKFVLSWSNSLKETGGMQDLKNRVGKKGSKFTRQRNVWNSQQHQTRYEDETL